MKIAIIYTSMSGNTKELAMEIQEIFKSYVPEIYLYNIKEFSVRDIDKYDAIAIGTYTWGNGEIPAEMVPLYREFAKKNRNNVVTGVFGTGDSFYPHYCGAVNVFRDLLKLQTDLSVTLKVELLPQKQDHPRCIKFVELFLERTKKLQVPLG